jgi:hypothetical protein
MLLGVQKSVREWTLTLASELPFWQLESQMNSWIFRWKFQGSALINSNIFLYHWKAIENFISNMGLNYPFGHLKHKLWSKERIGVKLTIWFPTTKSQESTRFPRVQAAWDISLQSSRWGIKICFRPHCNRRFACTVMDPKVVGISIVGILGLPGQNAIWMWPPWRGT